MSQDNTAPRRDSRPDGLTTRSTALRYKSKEAARLANTTTHQYPAAPIRAALQKARPGVGPEGGRA